MGMLGDGGGGQAGLGGNFLNGGVFGDLDSLSTLQGGFGAGGSGRGGGGSRMQRGGALDLSQGGNKNQR